MNRIDRLTGTILLLQGHRGLTAERIALHWEIRVRTVYRDLAAAVPRGTVSGRTDSDSGCSLASTLLNLLDLHRSLQRTSS